MKKVFLMLTIVLVLTAALNAAPIKLWVLAEPGYGDTVGEKLCTAIQDAVTNSDQFTRIYDDNPDHMFNLILTSVSPAGSDSVTCLNYELFFCVKDLPKLYVTSFLESYGKSSVKKAAAVITKRVIQDVETFYLGYPQYQPKAK